MAAVTMPAGSAADSGQAGIDFNSSATRGNMVNNAKFKWGEALLPYDPEIIKAPDQLDHRWRKSVDDDHEARTAAEYKAVAAFLKFLRQAGARRGHGRRPPVMCR